jgi:predicted TIM-barrel fold metal-dependent hydrolase
MTVQLMTKPEISRATDWRARFLETGLDEDMPIVDAHHHFFDLANNYHPWLCDRPLIPFRYGDYQEICRDFLPADYFAVSAAHRVVKTVLMEGEWNPRDPTGEARWVSQLHARTGIPHAMAAQAWLDREDIDHVLDVYADLPLVRSVRHKPGTVPYHDYRRGYSAPGSMRCPKWQDGYAKLASRKLMFELQAPWWHFAEAVELLRGAPQTSIIVNHAGLPADRSEDGLAGWRKAMELLAREANVFLKISGICVPGQRWTPASQERVVHDAIRIFGVERCMFASNFPVDGVVASFDEIYSGFKAITRGLDPAARLALFHDNAVRIYRLRL